MLANNRRLVEITLLFVCCLTLFTWGLSAQEVIGFDSRFYLFAQQMWRYGLSWFPMTYHEPYPDYPATSTAVIYAVALIAGGVNKFVAVLPTAMLAAGTVTLTYLIGRLYNPRYGWCAALLMLLSAAFVKSARAIALDMYPTFITTACFYLIYSAASEGKPWRVKWIYPLLFLGFAFRGPIGLVMPTGVVCAYYLFNGHVKKMFVHGVLAFLLLMACTTLLLALAYHVGGSVFLQDVLRMEVLGRIDNPYLPRYFYFTDSIGSYAIAYPLAWMVVLGVVFYTWKSRMASKDARMILTFFGWMLVILIGMSIPDDKKVRYVLPMLPAAALMAAYLSVAPATLRYFTFLRVAACRFFSIFPGILFIATIAFTEYAAKRAFPFQVNTTSTLCFFAVMQLLSVLMMIRLRRNDWRDVALLGVAALCFLFTTITIIEPIQLQVDSARAAIIAIENMRVQDHARLVFYRENRDGLPIKYLINMASDEQPVFLHKERDLFAYSTHAYVVTSKRYFEDLPDAMRAEFKIITEVSLGHVPVVVFKRRDQ